MLNTTRSTSTLALTAATLALLVTASLTPPAADAGAQDLDWYIGQDGSKIFELTADAAGNAYTTGQAVNMTNFGNGYVLDGAPNGTRSHYVWKIDPLGVTAWAVIMPSSGLDVRSSLIEVGGSDNVVTAGYVPEGGAIDFDPGPAVEQLTGTGVQDTFIHKLDGNGTLVWVKTFVGGDNRPFELKIDAAGNVYVQGSYQDTVDFDPGPDVFNLSSPGVESSYLAKLDPAGNLLWAVDGIFGHLWFLANGDLAVGGRFSGTVDLDPGPGVSSHTASGAGDGFVMRLTSSGDFVWAQVFPSTPGSEVSINDIVADATDSLYLGFYFTGAFDADPGPGVSTLTSAGQQDFAVVKLTDAGDFLWGAAAGGTAYDNVHDLVANRSGGVTAFGTFQSPDVDFDPGTGTHLLTAHGLDSYLWQLSATGDLAAVGHIPCGSGLQGATNGAGALYFAGSRRCSTGDVDDLDPGEGTFAGSHDWIVVKLGGPPELSVAPLIPGAELETVDVDVDLATSGNAIAATAFSVDYDETCLSFDDTDGDADDIPDDMTFHVAGDFSVTVFHDLGDADGEIDVSITDLAPPIATLADGALLTITFTATCEPAIDATIIAPVAFSSDPSATFGDNLAGDVDGTTTDGSVEIWPGPRGDCNRNDLVTAADLIGEALEIFDGDGDFWADVVGSTFAGSPVGCDANDDATVNAGDISCTILLIFGGTCGGLAPTGDTAFDPRTAPLLGLKGAYRDKAGTSTRRVANETSTRRVANETLWLPVVFSPGAHAISSVAFSLDLAKGVGFDPFDGDGDGLPDALRFGRGGRPDLVEVRYDRSDRDGELDLVLADYGTAFARGLLLEVALETAPEARQQPARFAKTPAASFGNTLGQAVPGHVIEARPGLTTGRK